MRKWYVICGVLAVLWLISLGTCSSNSNQVDRLEEELAVTSAQLEQIRRESEQELARLEDDYQNLQDDYEKLQAVKEMVFGKGLRVFDISYPREYYDVVGKVQNVSDKPMKQVQIIVPFYEEDGALMGFDTYKVTDLFPNETAEWKIHCSYYGYGVKPIVGSIYAFGNR